MFDIDLKQVASARRWAIEAHGSQMYGEQPYVYHLDMVVKVLCRFGHTSRALLAAGYLHDVVEDTERTIEEVRDDFGPRVAQLVDAVTDGPGKNRQERKDRPYRLIPTVEGAVLIKVADRISNAKSSVLEGKKGLHQMYKDEHAAFEKMLRGPLEAEPLFNTLKFLLA